MKLNDFIEGLQILRTYFDNPDGYHVGAEHDEFFVSATNQPIQPQDLARLKELGWEQHGHSNGGEYSPEDGWRAFM